jgi:hypothetical protein
MREENFDGLGVWVIVTVAISFISVFLVIEAFLWVTHKVYDLVSSMQVSLI